MSCQQLGRSGFSKANPSAEIGILWINEGYQWIHVRQCPSTIIRRVYTGAFALKTMFSFSFPIEIPAHTYARTHANDGVLLRCGNNYHYPFSPVRNAVHVGLTKRVFDADSRRSAWSRRPDVGVPEKSIARHRPRTRGRTAADDARSESVRRQTVRFLLRSVPARRSATGRRDFRTDRGTDTSDARPWSTRVGRSRKGERTKDPHQTIDDRCPPPRATAALRARSYASGPTSKFRCSRHVPRTVRHGPLPPPRDRRCGPAE